MTTPQPDLDRRPPTARPPASSADPQSADAELLTAELDGTDGALKAAAVGSAVWTILGFGTMQALRFGFNLVLIRLVAPQVFGVMAIVNLCVQALHMFSDLGIRQCVVRHARGDEADFLNTAWTLQIVRGLILWGLAGILAGPAAAFYDEMPELLWLLPLVGLTAVSDGFLSTSMLTLNRRLIRGRLVVLEICSYTAWMSLIVLAMWAVDRASDPAELRGRQLLVLGVGAVLSSMTELTASYFLLRGHRHRPRWDRTAARDLVHFGGWIFLNTATAFLGSQADRLVIGKISSDVLGVYHMAAQLARMPTLLLVALGSQLAFPLYSRLLRPERNDRGAVTAVHLLLVGGAAMLASGLLSAGPTLIECIYPPQYHQARDYIPLLGVWAWFVMLQSTAEAVLLATGGPRRIVMSHVAKLVALPPLLYGGYHWGGVPGLVVGYASAEVLRYLLLIDAVQQTGLSLWRDDLMFTVLGAGACALDLWAGSLVWEDWSRWVRLGVEVGVLVAFWVAVGGGLWLRGRVRFDALRRRGGVLP